MTPHDAYESWLEWVTERAAILEYEAGIPRDKAWHMALQMRVEWVGERNYVSAAVKNTSKSRQNRAPDHGC